MRFSPSIGQFIANMQISLLINFVFTVVFKSVRDAMAIRTMSRQAYPHNPGFLVSAYEQATKSPFSYILFDATNLCDEKLRCRSEIFPDDKKCTVWIPTKSQLRK